MLPGHTRARLAMLAAAGLAAGTFVLSAAGQPQRQGGPPAAAAAPTRADILRGEYGRYRANNDLLSYHLDVRVDPDKKVISGQEHDPLPDARGRHAHPARSLRQSGRGQDPARRRRRSSTRGSSNAVFVDFPDTLVKGRDYAIDFYYSGTPTQTGRFGGFTFGKDPAGRPGSTRPARARAPPSGGRTRISGATRSRAMDISVEVPNGLVDVSNGRFVEQDRPRRRLHALGLARPLPDQHLRRLAEHRHYEHFSDALGRPDARLLRAARGPRQGEGAVRAGQRHDRGVRALLRRVPVREGRLQAGRGAVHGHGTPDAP